MHLPGHSFTSPGTKLYKTLNPDGTPKEWSILINRLENAANHHDVIQNMMILKLGMRFVIRLGELNGIVNPTLRNKIDKSIVGKLINAKMKCGLGHPVTKS